MVPRLRCSRRVSLFTRAGPVLAGSGPEVAAVVFQTLLERDLGGKHWSLTRHRHRETLLNENGFPLSAVSFQVLVAEVHEVE
jgi:hypothetical protein